MIIELILAGLLPLLLIAVTLGLERVERRVSRPTSGPSATACRSRPRRPMNEHRATTEEFAMGPENRRLERHLWVQPERTDPAVLRGDEMFVDWATASGVTSTDAFLITEALVRGCWSTRLHALLGHEAASAVDADILTAAEAEVLLARLAVVIDQAVGASEN